MAGEGCPAGDGGDYAGGDAGYYVGIMWAM